MPTDLAAIVSRDAAWFAIDPAQGTDYTRTRVSLCGEAANDRRALLELLRETREALENVGDCHGCINNDHDAERALLDSLDALSSRSTVDE